MMQKVEIVETNQEFICGYQINNDALVNEIINFFNTNRGEAQEGAFYTNNKRVVDKEAKDSVDLALSLDKMRSNTFLSLYLDYLTHCLDLYVEKYQEAFGNLVLVETVNVQHYRPGGGFKEFHYEKKDNLDIIDRRHIVFMTYLNDIEPEIEYEGGTEFLYQKFKICAKKGLTLLWPSTWPFTHKSVVSNTTDKYIITGWIHKMPDNFSGNSSNKNGKLNYE